MVIENGILKYLEKKDVSDGILTIPKEVIEISSTFVDPVPWKLDDWHSGISRYGSKDVEWLEDTKKPHYLYSFYSFLLKCKI